MSEQAASTTQTSQQSSSAQSQSTSSDQGSGASSHTQISRPEYVPEQFWDATANTVKAPEFKEHLGKLAATQAAYDARLAARPEKPDGYKLEFPEAFKPEVPIKLDETDPRVAPMRALAHELNLDQSAFSKLLQIEASRVAAETKAYQSAVEAETKKLGANATARVTALKTWLTGALGSADAANDLLGTDNMGGLIVFSEAAIRHLEKLQLASTNQGAASYQNGGREPPAPPPKRVEEVLYPNMTARKGS